MRDTMNIRISGAERQELELRAKLRGMSVGTYIRFRALSPETDKDALLADLHAVLTKHEKEN